MDKWVWRFLENPGCLWTRVIKSRWGESGRMGRVGGSRRRALGWWGEVLKAVGKVVEI